MEEAGFEEIRIYITRRHSTVVQYIVTRPILEICERSVRRSGSWASRMWWYRRGLNQRGGGRDWKRRRAGRRRSAKRNRCSRRRRAGADGRENYGS